MGKTLKVGFILLLMTISLCGIFSRSLWKPDEPRVAEIGREMWLNHQYVIPTLNKEPFLEKPPLYWWVMSASYTLFGVSDGTARLPSALFGFLTLLLTYLIGKRVDNEKTGIIAALILATTVEFSIISHWCLVDNALVFFVTLGYYGFFVGYTSETSREKWIGYEMMAIAAALAFLSKGLVGPGLIAGPSLLVLIVSGEIRELKKILPQIGVGILIFLLLVTPWIIGLCIEGGNHALRVYLLQNTLGRMLPSAIRHYTGGHQHPFLYYLLKLPQDFIPWVIALPATAAFLLFPKGRLTLLQRKRLLQTLGLFAFGFLLLSLPGTKRGLYLVPLYPLLAISIGSWIAHTDDGGRQAPNLERYTLYILLGLFALVPLGIVIGSIFMVITGIGPRGIPMAPVIAHLTPLLALIVPLGLVSFLYLAYKLLQSFKSRTMPSRVLIFTTALLCVLAYHEGAVRIMDPVKSIHRFPNKMKPFLHANAPIAGFHVNELTRAMIPFDTGRYLHNFRNPEKLVQFLRNHPNTLLVIPKNKTGVLPEHLKSHLKFLTEQVYSRHFKVCLYRLTKPPYQSPPSLMTPNSHDPQPAPSPGKTI